MPDRNIRGFFVANAFAKIVGAVCLTQQYQPISVASKRRTKCGQNVESFPSDGGHGAVTSRSDWRSPRQVGLS